MTTSASETPSPRPRRGQWLAPTGLILLTLIPILGGVHRVTQLTGGAAVTAANSRFFDSPAPVIIHIVSVTVFSLIGALQFVPALRRRKGGWHRIAGRILIPAGALSALSGIWMVVFYPHPVGDGLALSVLRIIFGSAMLVSIGLGVRAIVRRNFRDHANWMTRAYAIGAGAGTQALVLIPGSIIFGATHELSRAVLMGAGWVINLAIAEAVIRRRARRLPRRTVTPLTTSVVGS